MEVVARKLTIKELAKRYEESERMIRYYLLERLIPSGRFTTGADYEIENEHDLHHRVYYIDPVRFREETMQLSPRSGLGRRLLSIAEGLGNNPEPGKSTQSGRLDSRPGGVDNKTEHADSTNQPSLDNAPADSDDKVDTNPDQGKSTFGLDVVTKPDTNAPLDDSDWKPTGWIAFLLELKDNLNEVLQSENKRKDGQIDEKDKQIRLFGATLRNTQQQLVEVTQERNEWRERALALPQATRGWHDRKPVDVQTDEGTDEYTDKGTVYVPDLADVGVQDDLNLTEEQIVLELFEIWRVVEHAVHNPEPTTTERLEVVRDRLGELTEGLPFREWRGHAVALSKRAAAA